jgi:hypothetical protein
MRLRAGLPDGRDLLITLIVLSQSRGFNRRSDPAVLLDCLKIVATLAATRHTSELWSRSDDRVQSTGASGFGAIGNLRLQQDAGSILHLPFMRPCSCYGSVYPGFCRAGVEDEAIAVVFPAHGFKQG